MATRRALPAFGVKLEDQVLLTANGAELLSAFPFDGRLLGGR
jgi:Xaa-Pro aminopeptidase